VNQRCISCARNALKLTCGHNIYNCKKFPEFLPQTPLKRRKGKGEMIGERGWEEKGGEG
jgi:hypothetical protein